LPEYRARGVIKEVMFHINRIVMKDEVAAYAIVERALGVVILRAGYKGKQLSDAFDFHGKRCVFVFERTPEKVNVKEEIAPNLSVL
jgi:hypothetical protein